jgi:polar amino acid transport system substrate-binding protein
MKNLKIIFSAIFFLSIVAFFYFFKSTKNNIDKDVLVVGTSLDYFPYEFVDTQTGQPAGFDIEVTAELARRMGKKLIVKNMPFTSLIFGLLSHEMDMIAAGMSATERRARMVLFTDEYVKPKPLAFISKKSVFTPQSIQDLYGKRVAVSTGYIADMKMSEHPEIILTRLENPANCFMALQVGSVDAFVDITTNLGVFLKNHAHPEQFALFEVPDIQESCAFAVNKDNQKLCDQINQTLRLMREDGALNTMQEKWNV